MIHGNYERILEKISKASGLDKEEIDRRVEAKRAKLSGLISKEGAAQVTASELGINFDNKKLKINEVLSGMKKVNTLGKIIGIFPVREFERNEKKNKVVNLIIADDTSNIKIVLWDTNHIELIEKSKIKQGDVVEIANASMRDNELHLSSFSEFKLSSENLENVQEVIMLREKNLNDLKPMDQVKIRAFIVQVFEPRFFYVCPECSKKAVSEGENFVCGVHGKIIPEKKALMNIVLDDGTENIRAVLFERAFKSLGLNTADMESTDSFIQQKIDLIGKELLFSGNARTNKLFNNLEFVIDSAEEINLVELIESLEKI